MKTGDEAALYTMTSRIFTARLRIPARPIVAAPGNLS
jgi:hypothetical protein